MKRKFFCPDCCEFRHRLQVIGERDETGYKTFFCKGCGSPVLKLDKVLEVWLEECVEYILKKGAEEDFQ